MKPTQYLTFQLAGEQYAIAILPVREIIAYSPLTMIPQAPPSVRGVVNLRGNVVPVVDLALKFFLPPSPLTSRTSIVILEMENENGKSVIGILADAVDQVVEWQAGDILPVPAFGTRARPDILCGMARAGAKFVLILNMEKVLAADEPDRARLTTARAASEIAIPRSGGLDL